MKAVIYARYSSDNQREESIEGQIRECKEFAERNNITILNSYIDRALSAKTDNRPEFQRMIRDSAKQLFDTVIVWKLDRFSRNRYDSAHNKAILRKNGVKVISAKELIAEDSTGILLESMLEGYAEYYSAELSEKVIRGMTDNVLKGKHNGGVVALGYKIDENRYYQLNPETAPIVKDIFTKYSEGSTIKGIVQYLNDKGIMSTTGKVMTISHVTKILHNRKYIGEYHFRDIVKENMIPPIISMELFNRVQDMLEKNKKAPARNKAKEERYLLTTKLFCGMCGAYMVGECGTSSTKKTYYYYKCATAKKKRSCKKKAVKKNWIEDLVVSKTMEIVNNNKTVQAIISLVLEVQEQDNTLVPVLKKQLMKIERSIENLVDAIQQGILTPSTKKRLQQLEETKEKVETNIAQEEIQQTILSEEEIEFWLHKFRSIDRNNPDHKQRLIDSFVNAIYLYEDKIVITFNYKGGTKQVTLKEVECSDFGSQGSPNKKAGAVSVCFFIHRNHRECEHVNQ